MIQKRKRKTQENIDQDQWKSFTVRDFMALKDLMDLLDENESTAGDSGEAVPPDSNLGVLPAPRAPEVDSRF